MAARSNIARGAHLKLSREYKGAGRLRCPETRPRIRRNIIRSQFSGVTKVSLIKFLLFGLLALFVLLPAAGILMIVGLPIIAVLAVVGLPIVGLLLLVGLPAMFIVIACLVVLGLVFGLLGLVVGLGIAALKIAFFIALPIFLISLLVNRASSRKAAERVTY
jgi:hypothetical protein